MNLDDLIRASLNAAAEETEMEKEDKVDLLLDVLTEFLQRQIEDDKS